jgi:hypothetical protein
VIEFLKQEERNITTQRDFFPDTIQTIVKLLRRIFADNESIVCEYRRRFVEDPTVLVQFDHWLAEAEGLPEIYYLINVCEFMPTLKMRNEEVRLQRFLFVVQTENELATMWSVLTMQKIGRQTPEMTINVLDNASSRLMFRLMPTNSITFRDNAFMYADD